jgi:hypothetical protein
MIKQTMNIESAVYSVGAEGENVAIQATIDGIQMSVPLDPANRHYQLIQEWIAEGNTIAPQFTDEEIAKQKAEQAKAEAQQYLNETDWIVVKIAEIQLAGGDVEVLKVKYATELSERKLMRELI